ncbi:MAG: hypothetical protein L0H93_05040 [Nocardioides sp.]|nr:hypothetical protein [Nocardioides sp.]
MSSRAIRLSAVILAGALSLTACGGGDDAKSESGDSASQSKSQAGGSAGDESTADGSAAEDSVLEFGELASVTWKPKESLEGTVDLTVQKATLGSIKDFAGFKLDAAMKKSTPYYVQVKVKNTGDTDLGGVDLPIFLDNGSDVLFPPARITSSFTPCPSRPLPEKFVGGKTAKLCLVFIANEGTKLESIAVRADEEGATIDWAGKVTDPNAKGAGKPKGKKGKKGKKNG